MSNMYVQLHVHVHVHVHVLLATRRPRLQHVCPARSFQGLHLEYPLVDHPTLSVVLPCRLAFFA